jgi:Abnormal spindle-like microcephaly-assoc'd, ASPM-SPD-2-Hydin
MLAVVFLLALAPVVHAQKAKDQNKDQQDARPPEVSIAPASLDFGDQVVKRASKAKRLTVTNTGGKPLYINSVVLGGDNQEDFTLSHDTCTGATITSQKSCVIDIVFTPATNDRRTATATLTDNALNSPQNVALMGNGINSANVPPAAGLRQRR